MKFVISREALLKPLNLVAGVVERRQTLPILSNVLLELEGNQLSITGTDLEVELVGRVSLEQAPESGGEITVPARKLADICKALPPESLVAIDIMENSRALVSCGRSRFELATLPAAEFPELDDLGETHQFELPESELKNLLDSTAFAMANQDVRYYLNGMLWEVQSGHLRVVATDGHRLALTARHLPNQIARAGF